MKAALMIALMVAVSSCQTVETELQQNTSPYGNRAHIALHTGRTLTGELLLIQKEHLWVASVQQRIVVIPLRDVASVEVLDTEVRAYLLPSIVAVGVPWVIIGAVGTSYTGEAQYLPTSMLIGGMLILLPVAFNEAGLSDPSFSVQHDVEYTLGPYLRYPPLVASIGLQQQLLRQWGQTVPDTLRTYAEPLE